MAADVPLFAVPDQPPVKRAKTLRELARAEKPTWTRYRPKVRIPCDECMAILHENDGKGPYARTSRWSRRHAGRTYLLCNAHADEWRKEETKS